MVWRLRFLRSGFQNSLRSRFRDQNFRDRNFGTDGGISKFFEIEISKHSRSNFSALGFRDRRGISKFFGIEISGHSRSKCSGLGFYQVGHAGFQNFRYYRGKGQDSHPSHIIYSLSLQFTHHSGAPWRLIRAATCAVNSVPRQSRSARCVIPTLSKNCAFTGIDCEFYVILLFQCIFG